MFPAGSREAVTTNSVARIWRMEHWGYFEWITAADMSMAWSSAVVYRRASAQIPKQAASRTLVPIEAPDVDLL